MKAGRRPIAALRAEEAEIMSYSSPPYLLHKLDPSHLGYLGRDDVLDLLAVLLATDLSGTRVEKAWVHAMLLRHMARIDDRRPRGPKPICQLPDARDAKALSATSACDQGRLEARLKDALPRLEDRALQQDLGQVLSMLTRNRQGGGLRRHG